MADICSKIPEAAFPSPLLVDIRETESLLRIVYRTI
jgi:hypothetical protein